MSTKTLFFYRLKLTPLPLFSGTSVSNKEYLSNAFSEGTEYCHDNIIINTLEFNEKYMFGSIGKLKDLNIPDALQRKRNISSKNIITDDMSVEFLLEYFTYFIIGGPKFEDVIVLQNSKAPSIKRNLSKAIIASNNSLDVDLQIKQLDDLSNTLKKIKSICEISFTATSPEIIKNLRPSIKDLSLLSKNDAERVTVELKYKNVPVTDKLRDELLGLDSKSYCKFKVNGCLNSDADQSQTIDFIENIISKHVVIEISDDKLKNNEEIKKILQRELPL